MNKDTLLEIAERLQEVVNWRKSYDTVDQTVTVTQDEYYIDFGVLGEQPVYVEVTDDYYPISVSEIMDHSPHDLENLMSDLREAIDEKSTASLDDVIGKMIASSDEQEAKLGIALKAVMDAMMGYSAAGAPSVVVSELPSSPMPWPGALRKDIDYTADDFPLRYQPPPGYTWTGSDGSSIPVTHEAAVKQTCESMRSAPKKGVMILDNKGRVSWIARDGDDHADENGRWKIWFNDRDGIPKGNGDFNEYTLPLAIDGDGRAMGWTSSAGRTGAKANWPSDSVADTGLDMVRKIREEFEGNPPEKKKEAFEPPAPVSV